MWRHIRMNHLGGKLRQLSTLRALSALPQVLSNYSPSKHKTTPQLLFLKFSQLLTYEAQDDTPTTQ